MFWHQKRDSSIWGSRDIKRFRTKKNLFGGGGSESRGHETWRNAKKSFRFSDRLPYISESGVQFSKPNSQGH